jgi:cyclophilin family peptidyl-prolyl cis-trans isomerase
VSFIRSIEYTTLKYKPGLAMGKILFICLLLTSFLNAQYTSKDKDLIRTTSSRTFDTTIVNNYLVSEIVEKVNAGLLSAANSKDSRFIPNILNTNFEEHHNFKLFALSQIGESSLSTNYILNLLSNSDTEDVHRQELFSALGFVADSITLMSLINNFPIERGIPTAIINFNSRKISSPQRVDYLIESLDVVNDDDLVIEILYALSRLNPLTNYYSRLVDFIRQDDNIVPVQGKLYTLNCIRKLKYFDEFELFDGLINHEDWRIRAEAARTLCYYNFNSEAEVLSYLRLLKDKNPNVSRVAGASVKDMKIASTLRSVLEKEILQGIDNRLFTDNTSGETFISLCSFFPNKIPQLIERVDSKIQKSFINSALKYSLSDAKWIFTYLLNQLSTAGEMELLHIVPAMLDIQDSLKTDKDYNKLIISFLQSEYASTISITADELDSIFIADNKSILQQIIIEQIFKFQNNPEYIESILSLVNMSKKISSSLFTTTLEYLKLSNLSSLKNYANYNLGLIVKEEKTIERLDTIIDAAFNYKGAKVLTNKGNFELIFLPSMAPVSVGNFVILSLQQYFANVLFHRVVPNFVIQTGDRSGTGWGGPGYEIISEYSPLEFRRGFVGMASAGKDTEGSQWFVMHSYFPHLNGRYTVFGEIINGMEVVDKIDQGDIILSIELR